MLPTGSALPITVTTWVFFFFPFPCIRLSCQTHLMTVTAIWTLQILGLISIPCLTSESESRSVLSNSLRPHGLYSPRNSPGQTTGVGGCSLLQGIFPTQGSKPGLLHCGRILYELSHQGSPAQLVGTAKILT